MSGLEELGRQINSVVHLILEKFLSSVIVANKIRIRISYKWAHLHSMTFLIKTTMFREMLFSGFSGVMLTNCFSSIFHFGKISQFKWGNNSQETNLIKISCQYAHHVPVLHNFEISRNSVERLQRSWADKKTRTDWLTDDGSKTLYTPQHVAWGYNYSLLKIIKPFTSNGDVSKKKKKKIWM